MSYQMIFIFLSVVLCLFILKSGIKEKQFIVLQIIFVTIGSLIFLEIKTILFFIFFILISFLIKFILKKLFYSKKRIKIIKK